MDQVNRTHVATSRVAELRRYGQSVWLDFFSRDLITSGELARLVSEDGLAGVTSNPTIFENAIDGSDAYADLIADAAADAATKGSPLPAKQIYEELAVKDMQDAADVLRPVYDQSAGADGFVSLEVAPDLAGDTAATVAEARRLWGEVNRPNLMIKVPATDQGLPAIQTLLAEGININITLLFSRAVCEQVGEAFLRALATRADRGAPINHIASVASLFVSRIDTAVDAQLAAKMQAAATDGERSALQALLGKVAIANAKLAYQSWKRLFSSPRWEALSARGARPQRLLWASTGTKNPKYRDVLYVEELIGPYTVNTMPPDTLAAFREHGRLGATLESDLDGALGVLQALESAGISLDRVTRTVLEEGIEKFETPWRKLLEAIERRARSAGHQR